MAAIRHVAGNASGNVGCSYFDHVKPVAAGGGTVVDNHFLAKARAAQLDEGSDACKEHRSHRSTRGTFDANGTIARERKLAEISNWTMDVRQVISDEEGIAMEALMDIEIIKDSPDFFAVPAKRGDRMSVHFCALYTLRDGRICQLRIFPSPSR